MASLDLAGIITRVCSDLAYRFAPLYHTHSNYAHVSHAHGTISSVGDITATAPTIASGDKLIINDESASKVTNGPSFGSSTTMFLANNGTWQTPAGTYSLPTASTSTLGGVKVDGSTITIADGVISSSGGGGGGSELTLYTDGSFTNLWIDAAKTTTLFESFEYDYHVAKAEMSKFSAIKIWDRYLDTVYFVNRWKVDPTDETFGVAFGLATYVTVSGGTSYWLLQAKSISLS